MEFLCGYDEAEESVEEATAGQDIVLEPESASKTDEEVNFAQSIVNNTSGLDGRSDGYDEAQLQLQNKASVLSSSLPSVRNLLQQVKIKGCAIFSAKASVLAYGRALPSMKKHTYDQELSSIDSKNRLQPTRRGSTQVASSCPYSYENKCSKVAATRESSDGSSKRPAISRERFLAQQKGCSNTAHTSQSFLIFGYDA
jgi:hypothetical protein